MAKNRFRDDSPVQGEGLTLDPSPEKTVTVAEEEANGEPIAVAPEKRTRRQKGPKPWLMATFTCPTTGKRSVAALAETQADYIEQLIEHRAANGNLREQYTMFSCAPTSTVKV